jgi:L-amino acid N-acyltransferase YncA
MDPAVVIRKARSNDFDEIWQIIQEVIRMGDTYVFDPDSGKEKMLDYWCGADKHTYVAVIDKEVVGTFVMKDNQPDLGSHVANASYMTAPEHSGKGIGRAMGEYSIEETRKLGYKAIQFNIVVKTNDRAVRLWQRLGFEIIGEIPDAFKHRQLGLTNAYIMWRRI